MPNGPIKVLIIDDSALVRDVLERVISKDRQLQVAGTAADPLIAIKRIKELKPQVLTLDLNMPRMDGLTFLEKLMSVYPMPVIVISSLAKEGSEATIKALELGAVDFVTKPGVGIGTGLEEMAREIIEKIKGAARVNMTEMRRMVKVSRMDRKELAKAGPALEEPPLPDKAMVTRTDKVITIGASTGGTVAVKNVLQKLPANMPGILIVLHMPAGFTASYAENLNSSCRMLVKEAANKEPLARGRAYVAPGGKHLLLDKGASGYYLRLDDGPPVNRHRPSVDRTFQTVAEKAAPNSLGVILTGMGDDGARGLKEMHDLGCPTIAQDERTSVVFGMPKQAIALGAVDKVLPIDDISGAIISFVKQEMR